MFSLEEGLLVSDSPKGEVRLGFPIHAAGWYFPELYPTPAGLGGERRHLDDFHRDYRFDGPATRDERGDEIKELPLQLFRNQICQVDAKARSNT